MSLCSTNKTKLTSSGMAVTSILRSRMLTSADSMTAPAKKYELMNLSITAKVTKAKTAPLLKNLKVLEKVRLAPRLMKN